VEKKLTVKLPIGDWCDGDAALENVLLPSQGHGCHEAAVAPAPHCHPSLVDEVESVPQVP